MVYIEVLDIMLTDTDILLFLETILLYNKLVMIDLKYALERLRILEVHGQTGMPFQQVLQVFIQTIQTLLLLPQLWAIIWLQSSKDLDILISLRIITITTTDLVLSIILTAIMVKDNLCYKVKVKVFISLKQHQDNKGGL